MQADLISNAPVLPLRLQYARRGTMVRSEKRPSPALGREPEQSGGQPPRKRPNRAGFFYKLFTLLALLILWPVGMLLLWRRRLRWSALMKLFISIVTMMACILLLGTALTVETGNPRITAAQDSAIRFMDGTLDAISDFSLNMGERVQLSLEALNDIREVYQDRALNAAADVIDWGVDRANELRARIPLRDIKKPSAEFLPDGMRAADMNSEEPEAGGDVSSETTAPAARRTPGATSAPPALLHVEAQGSELPVYIPAETPDADTGAPLSEGLLKRDGALQPGASAAPKATAEPEPEPLEISVKPAGQAIVYFNAATGKYYHMASACGSMQTAPEHAFSELAEYDHQPCPNCGAPEKSLLDEEYVAWQDEGGLVHISDDCPSFEGKWTLLSAEDAIAAKFEGCPDCGADRYLAALEAGQDVTLLPYPAEPEATDEPEVTDEPETTDEPEVTDEPETTDEPESTDEPEADSEARTEPTASAAPSEEPDAEPSDEPADASEAEPSDEPEAETSDEPEAEASADASPEAEASATPEAEPSASPEATEAAPRVVTPGATLKPAPEPVVYHTAHGKFYHSDEHCSGMLNAAPHGLAESIADGFARCEVCNPPTLEDEPALMLWQDEDGICHVSDECSAFEGEATLIDREEALSQGLTGCTRCFGADYLIPGSEIDPIVLRTPEPSATPEAEAEESDAA